MEYDVFFPVGFTGSPKTKGVIVVELEADTRRHGFPFGCPLKPPQEGIPQKTPPLFSTALQSPKFPRKAPAQIDHGLETSIQSLCARLCPKPHMHRRIGEIRVLSGPISERNARAYLKPKGTLPNPSVRFQVSEWGNWDPLGPTWTEKAGDLLMLEAPGKSINLPSSSDRFPLKPAGEHTTVTPRPSNYS